MIGSSVTMAGGEIESRWEALNWPKGCQEPTVEVPCGSLKPGWRKARSIIPG